MDDLSVSRGRRRVDDRLVSLVHKQVLSSLKGSFGESCLPGSSIPSLLHITCVRSVLHQRRLVRLYSPFPRKSIFSAR